MPVNPEFRRRVEYAAAALQSVYDVHAPPSHWKALLDELDAADREKARLAAEVAELREALRPFGEHLDVRLVTGDTVREYHADEDDSVPMFRNITVGDFRRAAAALAKEKNYETR